MCPNDTAASPQPLLPKRTDSLFGSEAGSDVVFMVGQGPELFRFPGHRGVLAAANPVFRAMFEGSLPQEPVIAVTDLDDRAFDNLLRYLYREEVQLQSVTTALATLQAADKYMCDGLVRTCVQYLDLTLEPASVLDVLQTARVYCRDDHHAARPSAPPSPEDPDPVEEEEEEHPSTAPATEDACSALLHNCLQFVDLHADEVLSQEAVEDLDAATLTDIARRPTLALASEAVLFAALERWSGRECRRRRLELSPKQRRRVLGEEALFSVRYGLMTSEQFLAGPMQSGLLDEAEVTALLALVLGHPRASGPPPDTLRDRLGLLAARRRRPEAKFARLSRRTEPPPPQPPPPPAPAARLLLGKRGARKDDKKAKRQHGDKGARSSSKQSKSSCIADYVFRALSCIFD
ncbi:BTB/POZ domain-containing protein 2-like [Bacillus rossius redtenbacheri]|uniref:BTB/POZ domain-containing protein 2-like n=1 Tax=Bacillus rossius redtenbacheri TaxID=93214 RepID=UPI002FDD6576